MRRVASLLSLTIAPVVVLVALADAASAASIYRWQDGAGGAHFSNRTEVVPAFAREVELPSLPAPTARAPRRAMSAPHPGVGEALVSAPAASTPRHATECEVADPTGVVGAVASRLARSRQIANLTLLVAGVPVAYQSGTIITVKSADVLADVVAPVEQAAIAYPGGARCPTRPPFSRYAASSGRRAAPRSLCDDYQRAFAEVGVAVSRDQRIARSFRAIAEDFAAIAARGYAAGPRVQVVGEPERGAIGTPSYELTARGPIALPPGRGVGIPPWVVEAHVAQTDELGDETAGLVEELTVALEEIDRAARAGGCW